MPTPKVKERAFQDLGGGIYFVSGARISPTSGLYIIDRGAENVRMELVEPSKRVRGRRRELSKAK